MNKLLIHLFCLLLSASVAAAQSSKSKINSTQSDSRSVEEQIIEIEQQWSDAFRKHDPEVFVRHVADDYVGIYPTNKITKESLLTSAKGGGARTVISSDIGTPKVRVFEKTVVVTGHAVQHVREKSGDITIMRTIYTEVFVLRDGRWQCVAGHYTPLASPE